MAIGDGFFVDVRHILVRRKVYDINTSSHLSKNSFVCRVVALIY